MIRFNPFILMAICGLLCCSTSMNGQSIAEQLGGVKTEFIIKSDTTLLNDTQQLIVKRGDYDFDYENDSESGHGYGYGYESYHLEFQSKKQIQTLRPNRTNLFKYSYFTIAFKSKDGMDSNPILLNPSKIKGYPIKQGEETIYIYSINLIHIPLILLDNSSEINIVCIREK